MEKQAIQLKPRHLVVIDGIKSNLLKLYQDVVIHQPSSAEIPCFNIIQISILHWGVQYHVNISTDIIAQLLRAKELNEAIFSISSTIANALSDEIMKRGK